MSEEMARKVFHTDFLFVGAGPACLSGAIRLRNQIDDHNDALEAEGKRTSECTHHGPRKGK